MGLVPVLDPETQEKNWIWSSSKKWLRSHKEIFLKQEARFNQLFTKAGAGRISISTKESYVSKLYQFFKGRAR